MDDAKDQSKEEVVSDKVVEIEKKISPKRTKAGEEPGKINTDEDEQEVGGHKEPDGNETEWFHNGGHTNHPEPKPGQPAHVEDSGNEARPSKRTVSLKKFVPVCVDKEKGQYMCMIVPDESATDGAIEIFLSAETQNYDAPIKSAMIIGGGSAILSGNIISGITFEKDQTIRLRVEIDYYEMCAMEVKAYAVTK